VYTFRVKRAFTLIELLVVIVIIAVIVAILLPGLGSARATSKTIVCGSKLHQLGVATSLYLGDFNNALPQMKGPLPQGGEGFIGGLFGGKKGSLPMFGLNQVGAERRPLNSYLDNPANPKDAEPGEQSLEAFRSPCDKGARQTNLPLVEFQTVPSMYDLNGSSYVINDHGLDGDFQRTLIPATGGQMPEVADPARTWLLGSSPIYCYEWDADRGQQWYSEKTTEASLCFVDMHVRTMVPVPNIICETENTTRDYTFLPVPGRVRP
jgi:prepilin-type N-terminal cleavage/methylation domain-containing protein